MKRLVDVIEKYKGSSYKIVCVCEGDKMPSYECDNEKDMKELAKFDTEIEKITFSRKVYRTIYVHIC